MSRCPDFTRLTWYLETGELPPGSHPPASCDVCRGRMDEYAKIRSALKGLRGIAEVRPAAPAREGAAPRDALPLPRQPSGDQTAPEDDPAAAWPEGIGHAHPEALETLSLARDARKLFLSDWPQAARLAREAVERARRLPVPAEAADRAVTLLARAEAAAALGVCDTFLDRLEEGQLGLVRALQWWEELGDPLGIGTTRHDLATVCMKRKSLAEAEFHARQAVIELLAIGEERDAARARNTLAIILGDRGRRAEAQLEFRMAMNDFRTLGMRGEWAMAAVSLARLHQALGETDEALRLAAAAEPMLVDRGFAVEAARCAWLRGTLQLEREGGIGTGLADLALARDALLRLGLWVEPAVISCEAAQALLRADRRDEARHQVEKISELVPADQASPWVMDAMAALRVEFERASNRELIGALQGLAERLARPEPPPLAPDPSPVN